MSEKKSSMKILMEQYKKESEAWWYSLSYDEKCYAFSAIVSRIYQAEIKERGSYRYAIYEVFGFGPDMYGVAMGDGYMEIHNLIYKGLKESADK